MPPPPPVLVGANGSANGSLNGALNGSANGRARTATNGASSGRFDDPAAGRWNGYGDADPGHGLPSGGYVPPADDLFAPRHADPAAPSAQPAPAADRGRGDGDEMHLPITQVMPIVGRPPRI